MKRDEGRAGSRTVTMAGLTCGKTAGVTRRYRERLVTRGIPVPTGRCEIPFL